MAFNMKRQGLKTKIVVATGCLALLVGGGLVAHAYAQQHGPGGHPPWEKPSDRFARMCSSMDARQAGALAFAEVKLGITEAERPAWAKFTAAIKASSAPMKQACSSVVGQPEPKTLPDRLHRMELVGTARLEQLRQVTPAVEALYAVLTPAQKEMAEQMVGGMMHAGHHPEMGHWHGDGPGPGGPDRHGPPGPPPAKAPN